MEIDPTLAAVVTGGASGLGEAVTRHLAARGARVAIFDLDAARGEALAAEVGGVFCKTDVCNEDGVVQSFEKARAVHGQERVLVNCAGIGNAIKTASRIRDTGAISQFPLSEFEKVVQVNLIGTFRCIARSAAGMLAAKPSNEGERGVIINTASVAAEDGQTGQAAYAASKAGIVGMTLPIARDLMNEGIRINTILPGLFATPLLAAAPQSVLDSLAASVPFPKRLGAPDEFAEMVLFMISNRYINGEDVRLDGAIRMAPR